MTTLNIGTRLTHSVRPRYSAGSPALVDYNTAMRVKAHELEFYQYALDGYWGEAQKARAERLGLSGIVEMQSARASQIEFLDEITDERGVYKDGKRIVKIY